MISGGNVFVVSFGARSIFDVLLLKLIKEINTLNLFKCTEYSFTQNYFIPKRITLAFPFKKPFVPYQT